MQPQLKFYSQSKATRPNWLPGRPRVLRRSLRVAATSGAAPPPTTAKDLPKDVVTRQYRRTVYDFALWAKHRDVNRYLYNLKTIPGSRIIRSLSHPMGVVLAWATLFGFYETCLESGVLPSYLPKLTLTSAEPQGLTSFALSLLLVFRTNSSYGRFDEARKIWGGILNRARNIANQAVTFIPQEDVVGREAVAKWTVGFCRALQAHLQEDADLRTELQRAQPRWTQQEIDILCNAQHRPIKAISMLSELSRQLSISQFQALQMQENVTFFYDALGGCERLLRTPIPVSYTRHTARFLTIWLSLLPLGLWERYHWSMLPVIALIGFLLLGIDEIGISIEEPFGILPLDVICTRAQTDVVSLLKDDPAVVKYISDVRQGHIAPPPEPVVTAVPVTTAAPAPPAGVSVGSGAASARSGSPVGQQPGVMQTVTSLFTNVKAGIGAVAPSPPRAPSPPSRGASPGRPNSFPRASAGTVTAATASAMPSPPPVKPLTSPPSSAAAAAISNGSTAPPPTVPAKGFTMSFNGLTDGAAAAAKSASAAAAKLTKLADSMTAGAAPPSPPPPPAAATAKPKAPPAATESTREAFAAAAADAGAATPSSSSSSMDSVDDGNGHNSNGRRTAANWREELAALRASRVASEPSSYDAESSPLKPAAAEGADVGYSSGDDAEDEVVRRFGGWAGRSRSSASSSPVTATRGSNGNGLSEAAYSNGNGYSSSTSSSKGVRPRTRSDWRDQL